MSKQSAEEALPLITLQNGKFVLGEQAAHMISSIKGEIGVIGVAGLYRTGKSYVLNRLLGKQDGFAIGPTVNPCTKGIYTWGRPIEATKNGKKIYYILIDTEGIGSIQQDQTYDAKIFSLTLLLSSYFIYNSMGMIDEHALDKLSLVANLTQNIQVKSNSNKTSERELSDYFPGFLWLLRDFSLKLEDESGRVITSSQYLENALQDR
jgi:GTPase SAR1 family protein